MMANIQNKNTRPEILVRKTLFKLGARFRIHQTNLPGSPDIVMKKRNLVIFVHGCFWHRHHDCKLAYLPKTNLDFWNKKFETNILRDRKAQASLKELGWNTETVWECETRKCGLLSDRLRAILNKYT